MALGSLVWSFLHIPFYEVAICYLRKLFQTIKIIILQANKILTVYG